MERFCVLRDAGRIPIRAEVVVLGTGVIVAGTVAELIGVRPGVDPHPAWAIVTGILIALLGFVRPGEVGFRPVMALLSTRMARMLLEMLVGLFLQTYQARAFAWEDHLVDDEYVINPPVDTHPNKAGYALLARHVADRIVPILDPVADDVP